MCIRVKTCCGMNSTETGTRYIAIFLLILGIITVIFDTIAGQWGGIASGLLTTLAGFILLYGVKRRSRFFLIFWLVIAFFTVLSHVFTLIYSLYWILTGKYKEGTANYSEQTTKLVEATVAFIISGAVALLHFYFWIVVYSFQEEVRENTEMDPEAAHS